MTATFLLAAIAVPVQAVAARGDSGGSLTPPPSSGRAPAPASPATGGASGPARGTIPAPAPRPARRSVPASARAPLLAPAPSARAPAPAPARGGATVPAPGPPPSQPLPEAQSSPTPNIEGFESPRKPEREWLPDKIILDEVPALVPQNQLARTAAALPSGDEPQLVQIARVRDKQKDGGGDVQVPLDGGRPARPAPSAPAQPAQLPRTGLDVVPLAAMGFAMMLAGLAVLRVSRLGRAAARQPTG